MVVVSGKYRITSADLTLTEDFADSVILFPQNVTAILFKNKMDSEATPSNGDMGIDLLDGSIGMNLTVEPGRWTDWSGTKRIKEIHLKKMSSATLDTWEINAVR